MHQWYHSHSPTNPWRPATTLEEDSGTGSRIEALELESLPEIISDSRSSTNDGRDFFKNRRLERQLDGLGGRRSSIEDLRSKIWTGSSFQWSFDLRRCSSGDGGSLCKNQLRECQLDGFRGWRSYIEGQYSLQPQSIRLNLSLRIGSFSGDGVEQIQGSGSKSNENHWKRASIQCDYQKSVGHQLCEEMPMRLLHWDKEDGDKEYRIQATRILLKCIIEQRMVMISWDAYFESIPRGGGE